MADAQVPSEPKSAAEAADTKLKAGKERLEKEEMEKKEVEKEKSEKEKSEKPKTAGKHEAKETEAKKHDSTSSPERTEKGEQTRDHTHKAKKEKGQNSKETDADETDDDDSATHATTEVIVVPVASSPKLPARTFTTPAGQTLTVIEHPDAVHDPAEQINTVPIANEKGQTVVEVVKPATVATTAVIVPATIVAEEVKPVVKKAPTVLVIPPAAIVTEQNMNKKAGIDTVVAQPPTRAKSVLEIPVTEKPLRAIRPATIHQDVGISTPPPSPELDALLEPIGIFPDYIAKTEKILFVQQNMLSIMSKEDYVITDEAGATLFQIDHKLLTTSHLKRFSSPNGTFLFDLRKRRFPSRGHRITLTNILSPHTAESTFFLKSGALHLGDTEAGPVVATFVPDYLVPKGALSGKPAWKVRVAKGLDMSVVAAICGVVDEYKVRTSFGFTGGLKGKVDLVV
ncbi:hypothetical protein TI39_contig342g00021 [Zymoseptoria brevis]|uniref:Uncharacterized protein n=1 Tax=Zymoseptoria brevis TaxID=1047168 RepID=A0A0F4GRT1_9PEZI|nr:hypothetical protein TI39_contig342g00021 [Zymoseptoria brevis]